MFSGTNYGPSETTVVLKSVTSGDGVVKNESVLFSLVAIVGGIVEVVSGTSKLEVIARVVESARVDDSNGVTVVTVAKFVVSGNWRLSFLPPMTICC